MAHETIIVECKQGVGVITLNRPQALNAINGKMWREIDETLTAFEAEPEIRAIVFTGAGDVFSAGGDVRENVQNEQRGQAPALDEDTRRRYHWHVATCTKPTIGAINGLVQGGAAQMATSLDIRVGCERTKFRFYAIHFGRINSTWNLPLQVGWPMAKELLLTARTVDAEECYRIGLLNHLVPSDQVMAKAMELALLIADNDPRMVQGAKELMLGYIGKSWQDMMNSETVAQHGKLKMHGSAAEAFRELLEGRG